MKTTDYTPIPCARYDVYEIAIRRRRRLRLSWEEHGRTHCEAVTPLDLETRAGAEYLVARGADGGARRMRLDRIRAAETL